MTDCKALSGFTLHAYCLMGNHLHLLIQEGKEALEQVFKRIGVRYVYWYNWKYKRTGVPKEPSPWRFQARLTAIAVNLKRIAALVKEKEGGTGGVYGYFAILTVPPLLLCKFLEKQSDFALNHA